MKRNGEIKKSPWWPRDKETLYLAGGNSMERGRVAGKSQLLSRLVLPSLCARLLHRSALSIRIYQLLNDISRRLRVFFRLYPRVSRYAQYRRWKCAHIILLLGCIKTRSSCHQRRDCKRHAWEIVFLLTRTMMTHFQNRTKVGNQINSDFNSPTVAQTLIAKKSYSVTENGEQNLVTDPIFRSYFIQHFNIPRF